MPSMNLLMLLWFPPSLILHQARTWRYQVIRSQSKWTRMAPKTQTWLTPSHWQSPTTPIPFKARTWSSILKPPELRLTPITPKPTYRHNQTQCHSSNPTFHQSPMRSPNMRHQNYERPPLIRGVFRYFLPTYHFQTPEMRLMKEQSWIKYQIQEAKRGRETRQGLYSPKEDVWRARRT